MSHPFTTIRYHFVWSTWGRAPVLSAGLSSIAFEVIRAKCVELGAVPLALGGVDDHVHLLVGGPATLAPAALIGPVKGASARRINQLPDLQFRFRWQVGYGVFSVSRWDEDRIAAYVRGQREHHRDGTIDHALEVSEDTALR